MLCSMEEKRKLDQLLAQKERNLVSALSPLQLCSSVLELTRLRILTHQSHLLSFLHQSLLYSLASDSQCHKCPPSNTRRPSLTSSIKSLARLQVASSMVPQSEKSLNQITDLSSILANPRCRRCIERGFKECLSFLSEWNLIRLEEKRLSKGDSRVEVSLSSLGDACAESSIPIYSGICHWIECLRLDSFEVDLTRQLLFITMGLWLSGADLLEPEWSLFSEMHNNFSPGELSVADFFGVSSVFILQMQCNRFMFQLSRDQPLDEELYLYSCHKRLWNALIIEDLLHFVGPANVLRKYKLTRGELAAVTKNARSQISATSIFAHHCGFEFLQTSLTSLAE